MTALLLSIHVLAAILALGPVAVAASMFPRSARIALASPDSSVAAAAVRILHRITRTYSVIGVLIPIFGIATGATLGILGTPWLIISMILTAGAAAILITIIMPVQKRVMRSVGQETDNPHPSITEHIMRRLGMMTGIFNLLWAIVVVLMISRPGSTTGAGI